LARSIADAEIPAKRTSELVSGLFETLKNTAKWQISSSILQGFTGALREAYSYAKNLNKALTDIKIVSDMTGKDLDRFAKKANRAARELSATTDEYVKASLIFF
jgi:hypothetical protein